MPVDPLVDVGPVLEQYGGAMGRQAGVVLCVLALVTVVVGVDVLFYGVHLADS